MTDLDKYANLALCNVEYHEHLDMMVSDYADLVDIVKKAYQDGWEQGMKDAKGVEND